MWWISYSFLVMFWLRESSCIQSAHCWDNPHCNGSISFSFLKESDCCKNGALAYIKCTDSELGNILVNRTTSNLCVPCPSQNVPTPTLRPCGNTAGCRPNERCLALVKTKRTVCVPFNCSDANCDKQSGKVCGEDKVTYNNECDLKCQTSSSSNTRVAYPGQCLANPTCRDITCKPGFQCEDKPGKGVRCVKVKVVCGTDGNTYKTKEDMRRQACKTGNDIKFDKHGPCRASDTPLTVNAGSSCKGIPNPLLMLLNNLNG